MNKTWYFWLIIGLICGYAIPVSAGTIYDVNGDGKEGLVETIHSLQVVAGLTPATMPGTYTNSLGMVFNLIPSGSFMMGSPVDEPGSEDDEQPRHEVMLTKPFYMQTTEVTQAQWNAVIVDNSLGVNPSLYSGDNHPVERVTWYDAASFANWLSFAEGKIPCYGYDTCTGTLGDDFTCTNVHLLPNCNGYRLPTEAEWEYAARATTTTAWAYTESYDDSADPGQVTGYGFNSNLDAIGWYDWNNTLAGGYPYGTKPVAKKQANKWGLYDMAGNVYDWCNDWYDHEYYNHPTSGTDPQGPEIAPDPETRVVRGGAYLGAAEFERSGNRYGETPLARADYYGFRLVLPSGQ